ncbi:MAG: aldo/keto reductase [Anaerolineales bacterium]|nr:aldo/keto reductase [Anaerolineales bacterium]
MTVRSRRTASWKLQKELGVTIIAYTPLESGLLSGKYHKNPELLDKKPAMWRAGCAAVWKRVARLVSELKKLPFVTMPPASRVALNWVINSQGDSVVTIPV